MVRSALLLAISLGFTCVTAFQHLPTTFSAAKWTRPCKVRSTLGNPRIGGRARTDLNFGLTGHPQFSRKYVAISCAAAGEKGEEPQKEAKQGFLAKMKSMFKMPSKEQLAAMGVGVLLSYGAISNINMAVIFMISWVTFGKNTGLSPLDVGQWPKFMAVYAGFWLAANFLRPFRVGAAVAISPLFDRLVKFWRKVFNISEPQAVAVTVFMVNVVGNICFLTFGTMTVAKIAGVPLFPSPAA